MIPPSPQDLRSSALFRYLLPFMAVAAAIAIHLTVVRFLPGAHFPFPFLYVIAAIGSAWYGGYVPGLLSCVIPLVVVPLALRPFFPTQPVNVIGLTQLVIISLLVSRVEHTQRKARENFRTANVELDARVRDRTHQLDV